jgi:hypothetical protein
VLVPSAQPKKGSIQMFRQLVVLLTITTLALASCVTDPADEIPGDTTEEVGSTDSEVVAVPALVVCLASVTCAAALFATLGAVIYTTTVFTEALAKVINQTIADYMAQQDAFRCPQDVSFQPTRTDKAMGCLTATGQLRCYSARHFPCLGIHTHGLLSANEMRNGRCIRSTKKFISCEGTFLIDPFCVGPTVDCGQPGTTAFALLPE